MPHIPGPAAHALVARATSTLGLLQGDLAALLGVSRRTVQRHFASHVMPYSEHLHTLARAVYPRDAALAAELAAEGGKTLEQLGIVPPAPPPQPAPPAVPSAPVPPPRKPPPTRLLVESIVCAAADTMQAPPAAVRDVLRAAFTRARGLGLTVEEIDEALRAPAEPEREGTAPEQAETVSADGTRGARGKAGRSGRRRER
ncbi:MAG TPA: hypothetical protein VK841_04235 [Polyangiaceae bacterium]|jgi:hypothetical protein|nr:hypothetical protein [Polyangiaceae bacterium]